MSENLKNRAMNNITIAEKQKASLKTLFQSELDLKMAYSFTKPAIEIKFRSSIM